MSIRPVEMNGMIQRTQDIGNLKQQEDSKPVVQQQNIEIQQEKQQERILHQVQHANEKELEEFRYDAREKGSNQYQGQPGKQKKKKEKKQGEDGRVILKGCGSSFDMKI